MHSAQRKNQKIACLRRIDCRVELNSKFPCSRTQNSRNAPKGQVSDDNNIYITSPSLITAGDRATDERNAHALSKGREGSTQRTPKPNGLQDDPIQVLERWVFLYSVAPRRLYYQRDPLKPDRLSLGRV